MSDDQLSIESLEQALKLSVKIIEQGGKFNSSTGQGLVCRCFKTFAVPYLDDPSKKVVACAKCDAALGWPRFK